MKKIISLLIIIHWFIKPLYGQEFRILNDSNSLKKELFKEVLKSSLNGEQLTYSLRFRDYVETFGVLYFKENTEMKTKLKKHFSSGFVKEVYNLKPINFPYTTWLDVFRNDPPDSVIFIKERFVDDFFYLGDSLRLQYDKGIKVQEIGSLLTIEPVIFNINCNNNNRTFAFVGFYTFQSLENFMGRHGSICLYERKQGKWEKIELLLYW
jgi:hypothetical protein